MSDRRRIAVVMARLTFGDCWEWQGSCDGSGYGQIGKPAEQVHRIVYEHLVGPIPDGLDLDHLCRNRRCCNPVHLEPVTRRENVLRGEGPTAVNARREVCTNGHTFDARDRLGSVSSGVLATEASPGGHRMTSSAAWRAGDGSREAMRAAGQFDERHRDPCPGQRRRLRWRERPSSRHRRRSRRSPGDPRYSEPGNAS